MRFILPLLLTFFLISCGEPREVGEKPRGDVFVQPIENLEPAIVIEFGLYASSQPVELLKDFAPVLLHLEQFLTERTGRDVDVRVVLTKTYDQGINIVVDGDVDFARFGPASYIEAFARNPDLGVLAIESIQNEKVFYGVIVVHANSPLQDVTELKGYNFAFGNDQSTIGRYLAQQYLANNGVKAVDLKGFEYLGRHDLVGEAVGDRRFVAGALNEKTFKRLQERGVPIRELARFENVTKPWIATDRLDPVMEALIREGLLLLDDPATLRRLKITGFAEGDDSDYVSIRESIVNNDRFFEGYNEPEQQDEADSDTTK